MDEWMNDYKKVQHKAEEASLTQLHHDLQAILAHHTFKKMFYWNMAITIHWYFVCFHNLTQSWNIIAEEMYGL